MFTVMGKLSFNKKKDLTEQSVLVLQCNEEGHLLLGQCRLNGRRYLCG